MEEWTSQRFLDDIHPDTVLVYRLVAGQLDDVIPELELDWCRAFTLHLWWVLLLSLPDDAHRCTGWVWPVCAVPLPCLVLACKLGIQLHSSHRPTQQAWPWVDWLPTGVKLHVLLITWAGWNRVALDKDPTTPAALFHCIIERHLTQDAHHLCACLSHAWPVTPSRSLQQSAGRGLGWYRLLFSEAFRVDIAGNGRLRGHSHSAGVYLSI